jgi:endonuclease-3
VKAKASPSQPKKPRARAIRPRDDKARIAAIIDGLEELYPDAHCELDFKTPFQLLVATILSAQCTDKRVNMVTPTLFAKYPAAAEMAEATTQEIEPIIQSTGFFRNKAKSIVGAARVMMEDFAGEVPRTMDELLTLPGVARKTANVVLGSAFGLNEGFVVDTHVARLAQRLELARGDEPTKPGKPSRSPGKIGKPSGARRSASRQAVPSGLPVKIEAELCAKIPRDKWTKMGHQLIWHGRRVCFARKPACHECTLAPHCPSAGKV